MARTFRYGVVVAAVWLACSLGVAAASAAAPMPRRPDQTVASPIISDTEAQQFVSAFWPKREHALATNDVKAGARSVR